MAFKNWRTASAVFEIPIIRNVILERINPGNLRRVMRMRGAIGNDRGFDPDPFEAVHYLGRHLYQDVVVFTEDELLDLAFGG